MKSIQETKGFRIVKREILETFTCEKCGRFVERTELIIPVGPNKGDKIIADYGCKCKDKALASQEIERAKRLKLEKMLMHFEGHSLLNESLMNATFENYQPTNADQEKAKKIAIRYVDAFDGKKNLLFSGTYGTGKSHLSVSITKKLMEQGKTCVFISLPKLLTKIKDTYNGSDLKEDQVMSAMKNVDLLVIDDIGAEQKTQWTTSKLFEIMDDRSGKATIYTTNLNSDELKNHIGERNFSRIMDNTTPVVINGNDYRRKQF